MINKSGFAAIIVLAACLVPSVASAQGLLGGLLGGGGETPSGNNGGVLGVVGGVGNSLPLGLGNVTSGLTDTVGGLAGGTGGGLPLGLDSTVGSVVGLVDNVGASLPVNLGGGPIDLGVGGLLNGGLINVDIGVGGGGGRNGTNGINGTSGTNGINGGSGSNGINGNNGRAINFASTGGGMSNACAGTNSNQLISLFQQSQIGGWNRASNIQLIPVRVCPELRRQVANWLAANGAYHQLVGAVASDELIRAALGRTNYQPGHVLGVQRQGSTLMVYVF